MGMANYEVVNLWLDDIRPAPQGWTWVSTVQEAIAVMQSEVMIVDQMSLDHDLGACDECIGGVFEGYGLKLGDHDVSEVWLDAHGYTEMPNCSHFGTGYDFVCWMEEHDKWPDKKPTVHSANPVGKAKMLAAIERHYEKEKEAEQKKSTSINVI